MMFTVVGHTREDIQMRGGEASQPLATRARRTTEFVEIASLPTEGYTVARV
jgi:hypothetical protein